MAKLAVAEIYEDAHPLKAKVSYGAEGVDDAVLAKAEAAIAAMHDEFLAWAEQDLKAIQKHYETAATLPEAERTHYMRELFAIVHGMKGQGGSFGFPIVTQIADSLSQFLESQTSFGSFELDAITVHIDALRMVIAQRLTDDGGYVGEKLLLGLKRVLEKFGNR